MDLLRPLIAGNITGIPLSIFFTDIVYLRLYGSLTLIKYVFKYSRMTEVLLGLLVIYIAAAIVVVPVFWKLAKFSPNALLRDENIIFIKKEKRYGKNVLQKKGFFSSKLGKHYLRKNRGMRVVTVLGFSMATTIMTVGFLYIHLNSSTERHKSEFQYRIRMYEYYDNNEDMNEKIRVFNHNMGFGNTIVLRYAYEKNVEAEIKTALLGNDYVNYINQDINHYLQDLSGHNDKTSVRIKILGYSPDEMERLKKTNDLSKTEILKDGEAYVLSRTYSSSGCDRVINNNIADDSEIKIVFDDLEKPDEKFLVRHQIEQLSFEPENCEYELIFIVNQSYYEKLFGERIPQYVYIGEQIQNNQKELYETLTNIEYSSDYVVTYPKREAEEEQALNSILNGFSVIMLLLTAGMALMILVCGNNMFFHLRRKEFSVLRALGVSNSKIFNVFLYGSFSILVQSQLWAVVVSYFITKHLYIEKYPVTGMYLYTFPYIYFILATGMVLGIWLLSIIPLSWSVRNLKAGEEIRNIG